MTVTANIKKGFPHYSEDNGVRTYDVKYLIETTAGEGVRAVRLSLPQEGAFYNLDGEIDLNAIAEGPQITRNTQNNALWDASQTYSTKKENKDCTDDQDDDPLALPADVTWPTRVRMVGFHKDLDGKPIATTAGEMLETTETEEYLLGCQIVRNVADWSPVTALAYYGTMNADRFRIDRWTFPKETARLVEWTGQKFFHQDCNRYYKTTMTLLFRARTDHDGDNISGWDLLLQNKGHAVLDENDKPCAIRDGKGNLAVGPVMLNVFGVQQAAGDPAIYLRFRRVEKTNFAGLFAGIRW